MWLSQAVGEGAMVCQLTSGSRSTCRQQAAGSRQQLRGLSQVCCQGHYVVAGGWVKRSHACS